VHAFSSVSANAIKYVYAFVYAFVCANAIRYAFVMKFWSLTHLSTLPPDLGVNYQKLILDIAWSDVSTRTESAVDKWVNNLDVDFKKDGVRNDLDALPVAVEAADNDTDADAVTENDADDDNDTEADVVTKHEDADADADVDGVTEHDDDVASGVAATVTDNDSDVDEVDDGDGGVDAETRTLTHLSTLPPDLGVNYQKLILDVA
jgi:hypothetical protein